MSKHLFMDDFAALTAANPDNSGKSLDEPTPQKLRRRRQKNGPLAYDERLIEDAQGQVDRMRAMDADVSFRATAIEAGKVPLKEVSLRALLKGGQLSIDPLKFVMPQGEVTASVHIDARSATAASCNRRTHGGYPSRQAQGKTRGRSALRGCWKTRAVSTARANRPCENGR